MQKSIESRRKICVILGAGASWDVRSEGSGLKNNDFRPPLARELFDLDKHPSFRPILHEYNGAVVLSQQLAVRSKDPKFDLEQELRRIRDHPNSQIRDHYRHVPPYLRDLLTVCSYDYIEYPSAYILLVQQLLGEHPSDVLFLSLNYDDLLEQALSRWTNGEIVFTSLEDYVRVERPVKLIKLHGSINWFRPIGGLNQDWTTLVRRTEALSSPPDAAVEVVPVRRENGKLVMTFQVEVGHLRGYPVLTAPLAGKGTAAIACPGTHLEAGRKFLADCDRFLIIGTGGRDDDLLEFLGASVTPAEKSLQVVCGSEGLAKETGSVSARRCSPQ